MAEERTDLVVEECNASSCVESGLIREGKCSMDREVVFRKTTSQKRGERWTRTEGDLLQIALLASHPTKVRNGFNW